MSAQPTSAVFKSGSTARPFLLNVTQVVELASPVLDARFLVEFLGDGRTPARALSDAAMSIFLPALEGEGAILELGAAGDYHKQFVRDAQGYVTSNMAPGCDLRLDMTSLALADSSVDAMFSVFALEHLYDFEAVVAEHHRVLKPSGRMLIVVPFLYYYHAAPDDYFRFSESALDTMLRDFKVIRKQALGNRWLLFAEFLHEKKIMGSTRNWLTRFLFRAIATPFLMFGLKQHDPRFATGFAYLCEKTG